MSYVPHVLYILFLFYVQTVLYMTYGIYRMICHTCHKSYIRQSGRKIETVYKEHMRYVRHNNSQSAYASHILQNTHKYGPLQTTIDEQSCARHNPLFQLAYSA